MLIKLNLARNCLKYLIRMYGINEIFVPYYSCNTIWKAIRDERCNIRFYHIDENFMPLCEFDENDFVLVINYFGIFEKNCRIISQKYKNAIIDNTHSFYSENFGLSSFKSLRKFFKVQNGAYLYTNKILNDKFETDNLNIPHCYMQENYKQFVENELLLNKEKLIKYISKDVEYNMELVNFEKDKSRRIKLFQNYHQMFSGVNLIKIPDFAPGIPYCYPLSTNDCAVLRELSKFTLLRLWDDIPTNFSEYKFLNNTIALPLTDENYAQEILSHFM